MTVELVVEDVEKVINWNDAPDWATAVVADLQGSYFWIKSWGSDTRRQEFGLPTAEDVTADTRPPNSNWRLIEIRKSS
ncbi:TPA: hypothetical protein ACJIK4_002139 [Kluyvera cryocrescens]